MSNYETEGSQESKNSKNNIDLEMKSTMNMGKMDKIQLGVHLGNSETMINSVAHSQTSENDEVINSDRGNNLAIDEIKT